MNELEKLKEMLTAGEIPFVIDEDNLCPNVIIEIDGRRLCDAIISRTDNGGYLEIMGAMTQHEMERDNVLTNLTAEEVYERFRYCYRHNTEIYL